MDMEQIRKRVDAWVSEEELPVRARLKIERTAARYFNPCDGMEPEEADAYWEFIYGTIIKEHRALLSIPNAEPENNFWAVQLDEFGSNVSAFNTHDFATLHPFNKYHWRLNKVYQRMKDLAITHSCISHDEGKKNIHHRFKNLVEREFRDKAVMLLETYKKYPQWVDKEKLFDRIRELNSQIRKCNKIWLEYAFWE